MESNADFYTQRTAEINGRHVWFHLTSTPIGNIFAVQYEDNQMEIQTKLFFNDYSKAEKAFKSVATKIVNDQL